VRLETGQMALKSARCLKQQSKQTIQAPKSHHLKINALLLQLQAIYSDLPLPITSNIKSVEPAYEYRKFQQRSNLREKN
jgi:hypothetical protein